MYRQRTLWCLSLTALLGVHTSQTRERGDPGFASRPSRSAMAQNDSRAPIKTLPERVAAPARQAELRMHRVPYRMSETLHLIVRAKLNGKGPYNFIVDTGAPAMFVTTATAKQAGAEKDDDGWATFERMELEGGALIPNAKARAEDIFQIRGMNSLGLPGVRLDGVLGYNILARFRMEFDLSKSTMTWTELDFDPPLPQPLRGDGAGGGPPELEMIGNLMQGMGALFRRPEPPPVESRGFLGIELIERGGTVAVKAVLAGSPAHAAGLKPGDKINKIGDASVHTATELLNQAAQIAPNQPVRIQVERGGEVIHLTVTTGRGF